MRLLREPDFRNFWLGQTISLVGDQVSLIALPLAAVLVLDAGAADMGLLTAAAYAPHLLLSLPAGVWLDRVARRLRVMIAADIVRALLFASVPLAYALDALTLAQLYAVAFLAGCLAVFFDISFSTVYVAITTRDRYVEANSLLHGSRSFSFVAGPRAGGLVVQAFSAPFALLADAVSFLVSAGFLRRIGAEEPPITEEAESIRSRVRAGVEFIARSWFFRPTLASVATLNFFNFAFQALFVLFATRELGVGAGTLGLILGVGAIGGIVGAVVASRVGRVLGLGRAFLLGMVLFPAPLILVPLAGGPQPLVVGMLFAAEFLAGLGVMILDINVGALMLAFTPHRLLSRAMGTFRFVNYGVRPLGALLGGALGSLIGVRPTLYIATGCALAGVLWLLPSQVPSVRELPEEAA